MNKFVSSIAVASILLSPIDSRAYASQTNTILEDVKKSLRVRRAAHEERMRGIYAYQHSDTSSLLQQRQGRIDSQFKELNPEILEKAFVDFNASANMLIGDYSPEGYRNLISTMYTVEKKIRDEQKNLDAIVRGFNDFDSLRNTSNHFCSNHQEFPEEIYLDSDPVALSAATNLDLDDFMDNSYETEGNQVLKSAMYFAYIFQTAYNGSQLASEEESSQHVGNSIASGTLAGGVTAAATGTLKLKLLADGSVLLTYGGPYAWAAAVVFVVAFRLFNAWEKSEREKCCCQKTCERGKKA